MGVSRLRILFVHILPNIFPSLLVSVMIGFNNAILAESGMSYLGIGVQAPDASLGMMLSDAQGYLQTAPGMHFSRDLRSYGWCLDFHCWARVSGNGMEAGQSRGCVVE